MARYNLLVRKIIKDTQFAANTKPNTDVSDTKLIDALWINVSQSLDANTARALIMQPDNLINLIQNKDPQKGKKHTLKCFYAVHAILLALMSEECTNVLNQMSDKDIDILKQCLNIVQKYPCPKEEDVNKAMEDRLSGKYKNDLVNAYMIKSSKVTLHITGLWDEAMAELHKWSDAIDNFERKEIQSVVPHIEGAKTAQGELWTIEELASKVDNKSKHAFEVKKHVIIKNNPDRADEIRGWFTKEGQRILFNPVYFDELQKLWAERSERTRGKAKNKSVTKQTTITKEKTESPKTLVDMKAFAKYINKLIKECKKTSAALKEAEEKCADTMAKASTADPTNRGDLLKRALKENDSVAEYKKSSDEFRARLDFANKLLQDRQHALDLLTQTEAEITRLLQPTNQQ